MSDSEKKTEITKENQVNFAFRVTIITLLGYGCGLIFFTNFILGAGSLIGLTLATVILGSKSQLFYQSPLMLFKFILTTYIFGVIHSYTYEQIISFINRDPSQA
jgi:hypothetical protein